MFDLSSFIWVVGRRKRREHNTVGYDLNIRGSVWPAGCGNVSNIKDNFSSDSLIKDTDIRETGGSALCNMNDIPSFLFLIWVMKYQACLCPDTSNATSSCSSLLSLSRNTANTRVSVEKTFIQLYINFISSLMIVPRSLSSHNFIVLG